MPVSVNFDIDYTLRTFHSPKADPIISNYFNNGGKIAMKPDNKSFYISGGHVNGLEKNGTDLHRYSIHRQLFKKDGYISSVGRQRFGYS